MDAISDPVNEQVVAMLSSQVGKTEILNNVIAYYICADPSPILMVLPTLEMAETHSKDRFAPMIRDTPALRGRVSTPRSRDSGNTIRHKSFAGGHITFAGANSPASLASRPIRVVLGDEIDRWLPSVGTEGDPVALSEKRTTAFWNRKLVWVSSPTIKGASRIDKLYKASDQRRFFVACPHCKTSAPLQWKNVKFEVPKPETAVYVCEDCGSIWTELDRRRAVAAGKWKATAETTGIAGFHLNELYSPWVKLSQMVDRWLRAQGDPEQLQVFINTALAETYEEKGEGVESETLLTRGEDYGPEDVPLEVVVVTAGVDVQEDRLELEVVGWAENRESWSIEYQVLTGDPAAPEVWDALDDVLFGSVYTREDGATLKINASAIDTGGSHTQRVYDYVRPRQKRRLFGIKGAAGNARPIWPEKISRNNKGKIALRIVGVDSAKELIYAYLEVVDAGLPGYCHFPIDYEADYFVGLTCEHKVSRWSKGFRVIQWVKSKDDRNEPLDCRVYALAALLGLNPKFKRVNARLIRAIDVDSPAPKGTTATTKAKKAVTPKRRRPSKKKWVEDF